jgi:hypothetical protein
MAIALMQCSSSRKQTTTAAVAPDVSQVPQILSNTTTQQTQVKDSVAIRQTNQQTDLGDSAVMEKTFTTKDERTLYFSKADFSIYDTNYGSLAIAHKQKSSASLLDSGKYNQNIDLGTLSSEQAHKVTMNLSMNLLNTEILVLSLVDPKLFENFEKEDFEKNFAHYGAKYIVIAASKSDSKMRASFMAQFYEENFSGASVEKAFNKALKASKHQNKVLDFKVRLLKK